MAPRFGSGLSSKTGPVLKKILRPDRSKERSGPYMLSLMKIRDLKPGK